MQEPIRTDGEFILKDQLQELHVIESVAGGLLQPHFEGLGEPGQPEFLQGRCQRFIHGDHSLLKAVPTSSP